MGQSKPAITGATHTLPFDKLSPGDFERLCLWLVEREGYTRAEHFGLAGSEQGRDVVAHKHTPHGEELWYFQCKRYSSIYPGTLKREVDKYVRLVREKHCRPAGVVFVVSCAVSARVREEVGDYCEQHGLAYEFWALTELDMRVKRHPEVVEEFFQAAERNIIQRILGIGPDERRALRNRRAMLELVRNFWVKGVLEQSLHNAAMIELGMEERLDAVEHPWDMVLQTDRGDRTLPPGTKIIDVFDEMGRNLLILGEPGSGKTTMILELARATIARAEGDPTQPIPVVFNLSLWADKQQPIAEWLVDELTTKYNIPKKVARPWVESDELLLLLDGLDEVALKCRDDCVKAINEFRQEHLVPVVVCSRVRDYESLTARLSLQGAILLQPLTPQQVDDYLAGAGTALSAVRQTLQHDPTLLELAQTPLMLSIMTLAYRGMSFEALRSLANVEARRQHLFSTYVQRMFERRMAKQPYPPERTIGWLSWLAQQMTKNAQTEFLLERMQPGWLSTRVQRWLYTSALALVSGLSISLSGGISGGIIFGVITGFRGGPKGGMIIGSFVGLIIGLTIGERDIQPVEVLRWSWRRLRQKFPRSLLAGVIGGLSCGFVLALITARLLVDDILIGSISIGLGIGLGVGLFVGLILGLGSGLSTAEIETRIVPNQGIRQSARNALVVGLPIGLVGGVSLELVVRLSFALLIGLMFGLHWQNLESPLQDIIYLLSHAWSAPPKVGLIAQLGFGLSLGLLLGLLNGGVALTKHYVLRLVFWFSGCVPRDYAHFLNYAVERIFLRRVGGGYIFIHRVLQDYFASLYQGQSGGRLVGRWEE